MLGGLPPFPETERFKHQVPVGFAEEAQSPVSRRIIGELLLLLCGYEELLRYLLGKTDKRVDVLHIFGNEEQCHFKKGLGRVPKVALFRVREDEMLISPADANRTLGSAVTPETHGEAPWEGPGLRYPAVPKRAECQ